MLEKGCIDDGGFVFPLIQLPRKSEATGLILVQNARLEQFPLIQLPRKSEAVVDSTHRGGYR